MCHRRLAHLLVPAVASLSAASAAAQASFQDLTAPPGSESFGWALASLGDIDGDGATDFAVSAPSHNPDTGLGRVFVYSGAGLGLLWEASGTVPSGDYGYAVDDAGDVDGDGVRDLIVGAPDEPVGSGHAPTGTAGLVELRSGASGALLRQIQGLTPADMFGRAVAGLDDVDGDGIPDQAVGAQGSDVGGTSTGSVRVVSGADGSELYTVHGSQASSGFGQALAGLGDIDGDGIGDWIVGAPSWDVGNLERAGAAFVHSGASGALVHTWLGVMNQAQLGAEVADLGDVDGDGVSDIGVGATMISLSGMGGAYYAYSGASMGLIHTDYSTESGDQLGRSMAQLDDLNGDGRPEILVGAPVAEEQGTNSGHARLYDGANGVELGRVYGEDLQLLGLSGESLGDLDGDGTTEFAVGGNGPGSVGIVRIFSAGLPMPPSTYCTGKPNSQGCVPSISAQGTPSLSGADDFVVGASQAINQKLGLLIWSREAGLQHVLNAQICLEPLMIRTPVVQSGGNPGGDDCSGTVAFHFTHAYMLQQGIGAGTLLHVQAWYRDPGLSPAETSGLSDALVAVITP